MRNKRAKELRRMCMDRDDFIQAKRTPNYMDLPKGRIHVPNSGMKTYRLLKRFY